MVAKWRHIEMDGKEEVASREGAMVDMSSPMDMVELAAELQLGIPKGG